MEENLKKEAILTKGTVLGQVKLYQVLAPVRYVMRDVINGKKMMFPDLEAETTILVASVEKHHELFHCFLAQQVIKLSF